MTQEYIWEFISYYINFITTCFSSCYIYFKVLNKKPSKISAVMLASILPTATAFIVYIKSTNISLVRLLFVLMLCTLLVLSLKKEPMHITVPSSIISVGAAYCIEIFTALIAAIILYILNFADNLLPANIVVSVFQIIATVTFMHIKRFRGGFSFFHNKDNLGLGLIISGFVIAIVCIIGNDKYVTMDLLAVLIISSFITASGLFIWIKRSISKHYLEKLHAKELAHYEEILLKKEAQTEKLLKQNALLARTVHRDNHLCQTLSLAVSDILNGKADESALREIEAALSERRGQIEKEQINQKLLPETGIELIDSALANMFMQAAAHKISFDISQIDALNTICAKHITVLELQTLLCDHLKDAIIAISSSKTDGGRILLSAADENGVCEISFFDNADDFEIPVLLGLGIEPVTSHIDDGGTGNGFMTSFELMKKSGASLIINEFESRAPFTKSVVFRFDGRGAYVINSYRSELLKELESREDIEINSV